ncbi:MAG: alpha/beta fold hydrolase [Niabella sp.]
MKIYCLPGFGVDEKIFGNLKLNAEMSFINWLNPLTKETIEAYAKRMASSILDEEPVIIGISFGGMMALEIAKQQPVKKIILISSIKHGGELPLSLRWIGKLKLNRVFPVKKIQQSDRFYKTANRRLGAYTKEEQAFANAYRKNASLNYINWSFEQILNWKNKTYPDGAVHIHGNKDLIFPIKYVRPTHVIDNGTHMMAWNRADEISRIINDCLASL